MERGGAVILVVVAMVLTPRLLHESVAKGNMGFQFLGWAIPVVSLAFVVWAVFSRGISSEWPRRASLLATMLLACGAFTLLRSMGVTGDGMAEFTWRWRQTAEQRLLARTDDEPLLPRLPTRDVAERPLVAPPARRGSSCGGA